MQSRHIRRPAILTGVMLLMPLAMSILDKGKPEGDGWHWGPGDFMVSGVLLFGAGLAYEVLAGRTERKAYRVAIGIAVALVVFAIWFELAVDGVSKAVRMLLSF